MPHDEPYNPEQIGGAFVNWCPQRLGYELWLTNEETPDGIWWSSGINWEFIQRRVAVPTQRLILVEESAQQLMDQLWKSGVRPSEKNVASVGHLADMRKIAEAALIANGVQVKL